MIDLESKYAITDSTICNPYIINMTWKGVSEDVISRDLFWTYKIEDVDDPKVWIKVAKSKSVTVDVIDEVDSWFSAFKRLRPWTFGVDKDWYIADYPEDLPYRKRKEMFDWFLSQKESGNFGILNKL